MLEIKDLYKKYQDSLINDINVRLGKGAAVSIECGGELGDILVDLILNREIPGKGQVFIDGRKNSDYVKTSMNRLGIVWRNESLYERLTAQEYMESFNRILGSKADCKEIMLKLGLLEIANIKIKKLSYSQKRRLCFARERLKNPELMILQEPLLNMDSEGIKIMLENIEEVCSMGTSVLSLSVSFKDIMMLPGIPYILDENGLRQIHNESESTEETNDKYEDRQPVYKIEKIPAKLDERILLFDPVEIDYIESEQGISSLSVRGEKFPCALSLSELEARLVYFGFFRSHRSYLVNLQRVKEVVTWTRNSYSLSLSDKPNSSIPLSKGRLDELRQVLKI